VIALGLILAITAGWWALALWPTGAIPPDWLVRTRAACFGARFGGLPNPGGWLILIGQPIGMLGFLIAGWGGPLRRELTRLRGQARWRVIGAGFLLAGVIGVLAAARRVAQASAVGSRSSDTAAGMLTHPEVLAPAVELIDQHGQRISLTRVGKPVLLAFAYGHCTSVCPTIVRDLGGVRARTRRTGIPIFVVTLDPWRDVPERLESIATAWDLKSEDRVLSGAAADVELVLDRLGIGRRRDLATGDLDHSATVMLLDRDGRIVWRLDGGGIRNGLENLLLTWTSNP
jgi:protein SCO1/2